MALYLVRHASAGHRYADTRHDDERPLDDKGRHQAQRLADHLIGRTAPPVRIVSSPALRCTQTVAPLARLLDTDVTILCEIGEGADLGAAWRRLETLADLDGDAVACSHGDLIPEVIHRARGRGMTSHGGSGCAKGSVWRLEWDGERFTDGYYEASPPTIGAFEHHE
ncbi:MAG: phosphoglycerate mutase family protein [Microthrixaceae bacterium]